MRDDLFTSRRGCLLIFSVFTFPVLVAIWCVPWFVTQDGPAHLYNAHIMLELLKPDSPFGEVYTTRWHPLPNLAGHLSLMGLMSLLSERTADRAMMSLTFIGFAGSVLWLRWQVAGSKGMALIVPLAVVLALNWMWLLGFYNFLLGACLFSITLGVWWGGRERLGPSRALALAGLLVLGYACHLVSLGLTVVGLVVLSLTTPGPGWLRRCLWTSVSLAPLVPLGIMYHRLTQSGGKARPAWRELSNIWSPGSWYAHLLSADSLQLSNKQTFPFIEWTSPWFHLLSPSLWVLVALILLLSATILAPRSRGESPASARRSWAILALLLLTGWFIGPDDFGEQHGMYLRERVLLLGLVSIVPVLKIDLKKPGVWVGTAVLVVAVVVQGASIWDYALTSDTVAGDFMQAKPHVGTGQRIKTLVVINRQDPKLFSRFRVKILDNLDSMFGIGTDNIVWNNYEAVQYYFPVKYRDDLARCHAPRMDMTRKFIFPYSENDTYKRLSTWADQLSKCHNEIDMLVVWGADPRVDAINTQWFSPEPIFEQGGIRVFKHR